MSYSSPSKENSAANNLLKWIQHVSELSQKEDRDHATDFHDIYPSSRESVVSVIFTEDFKKIKPIKLPSRDLTSEQSKYIDIFSKLDSEIPSGTPIQFASFDQSEFLATAQIIIVETKEQYFEEDCSVDCIEILGMYSKPSLENKFRVAPLFLQLVIEQSFKKGLQGRVFVTSDYNSGQFYFQLGFVPVSEKVYQQLLEGKEVDGGKMYLPQKSIEIWKEFIATNALLFLQNTKLKRITSLFSIIKENLFLYTSSIKTVIFHIKDKIIRSKLTREREEIAKQIDTLLKPILVEDEKQLQQSLVTVISALKQLKNENEQLSKRHGKPKESGRLNKRIHFFINSLEALTVEKEDISVSTLESEGCRV